MKTVKIADSAVLEDSLADAIPLCSTDRNGRICSANETFAALLGYRREEIVGTQFGDLAATPLLASPWQAATAAEKTNPLHELILPRKDGTLLTALAYVKRTTGDDGQPLISWMLTDSRHAAKMVGVIVFMVNSVKGSD